MLEPKKQSALTLTAVQVAGATSLPVLHAAVHLYHQYGFLIAFFVLLLVNILTWCAALGIVSMTAGTTKNTLENARDTIGFFGGYLVALILIFSTIAWFVLQTNLATEIIRTLFSYHDFDHINTFIQIGVGLGILSTLVSMEGIIGLRWTTLISFPLILLSFILLLSFLPAKPMHLMENPASYLGLVISLGASLSIAVDYPTFFQFSRSKRSSLVAISAIQVITFLIGVGGLFLGRYVGNTSDFAGWQSLLSGPMAFRVCFFILVLLSCLCVNAVNIFSASIGWEVVVPILAGRKEYTILGLGLTSAFVLMTQLLPMHYLRIITEISLSSLCLVLIVGYLSRLSIRGHLKVWDQWVYFFAWLFGTICSLVALQFKNIPYFVLGFAVTFILSGAMFVWRLVFSRRAGLPRRGP